MSILCINKMRRVIKELQEYKFFSGGLNVNIEMIMEMIQDFIDIKTFVD